MRAVVPGLDLALMRELRLLTVFSQGRGLHRFTILHTEVSLGNCDTPVFFQDVHFGAAAKIWRCTGTNSVGVVTGPLADAPGALLAISEEQSNRIIGMAGLRPIWSFDRPALEVDLQHVLAVGLMIVLVLELIESQPVSHGRADHRYVVPSHAGQWFWGFLQPAVV